MRVFKFLFLALMPFLAFSQITSDQVILNLGIDRDNIVMMRIKPDDPTVEGSPWLFEDWKKCQIETKKANALDGVLTNYHIINDELYLKLSSGYASVQSDEILEIKSEDGEVYFRKKIDQGTFLRALYIGKNYSLFEHLEIIEKKPDYNVALDVGSRNLRLLRKKRYFVEGEEILEVTKKKNRKKLFEENLRDIDTFVRENNLSWQNPNSLVRIIEMADTGL